MLKSDRIVLKISEGEITILHRHDINDEIWEKIDVNLPGSVGHTGRNGVDNRCFTIAVFWILRIAAC